MNQIFIKSYRALHRFSSLNVRFPTKIKCISESFQKNHLCSGIKKKSNVHNQDNLTKAITSTDVISAPIADEEELLKLKIKEVEQDVKKISKKIDLKEKEGKNTDKLEDKVNLLLQRLNLLSAQASASTQSTASFSTSDTSPVSKVTCTIISNPINEDDDPDRTQLTFTSQDQFDRYLQRLGAGGLSIPGTSESIIDFNDLINGQEYVLRTTNFSIIKNAEAWAKNRDRSFEDESTATLKSYGESIYGELEEMPREITVDGVLMEFDGVLKNSEIVLVNEAKNNPRDNDIDKLLAKTARFQVALTNKTMKDYEGITLVKPFLSGHYFHPLAKRLCKEKKLSFIYPNGSRLLVVA